MEKNNLKDISVILPVYNGAHFLESCIQSVKAAGDRVLEIIIVDDGSTDDTLCTAQKLSELYHELIVLHMENHGAYTARRNGIAAAKGKYIAFIDVDDRFCKNALNDLAELLESNDADIAIGQHIPTYSYDSAPNLAEAAAEIKVFPANEMWTRIMRWRTQEFVCYCWNKLYKKSVVEDLIEADQITQGDDVLITCQAFLKANRVVETSQAVYLYYQYENSITHGRFGFRDIDLIRVWDNVCELMKEQDAKLYNMAQINRWRTDFTLICRLILADDRELEKIFAEDLKKWRSGLRKHYGEIIRARSMPLNRLLIMTALRFAFIPTKFLMQVIQRVA